MKRLFIALEIQEKTRSEIFEGILNDVNVRKMPLRLTPMRNLHLTLQFLGDIEERRISTLKQVMDKVGLSDTSLKLEFTQIGAFPNMSSPGVIWLGIRENRDLTMLQRDLTAQLIETGFSVDRKLYKPHLTLGRVKNNCEIGSGEMEYLKQLRDGITISPSVSDRITLFESRLQPGGPIYTGIYEKKLFF